MMGPTVLIVADEVLVTRELTTQLEAGRWRVLGPTTSESDMVRLLARTRPDAALVDVQLHERASAAVVRRLRDLKVPVALAGAHPDHALAGGSPFARLPNLSKPIHRGNMLAALNEARGAFASSGSLRCLR